MEELDVEEHHAEPAATIMFELDRDYYEDVIDAVEEAFHKHTDDLSEWVYPSRAEALSSFDT